MVNIIKIILGLVGVVISSVLDYFLAKIKELTGRKAGRGVVSRYKKYSAEGTANKRERERIRISIKRAALKRNGGGGEDPNENNNKKEDNQEDLLDDFTSLVELLLDMIQHLHLVLMQLHGTPPGDYR